MLKWEKKLLLQPCLDNRSTCQLFSLLDALSSIALRIPYLRRFKALAETWICHYALVPDLLQALRRDRAGQVRVELPVS